jgi:hypothetical protein
MNFFLRITGEIIVVSRRLSKIGICLVGSGENFAIGGIGSGDIRLSRECISVGLLGSKKYTILYSNIPVKVQQSTF